MDRTRLPTVATMGQHLNIENGHDEQVESVSSSDCEKEQYHHQAECQAIIEAIK